MNLKKVICTVLPLAFASQAFSLVTVLSMSNDGKYVVTDGFDKGVALYNINKKTSEIVGEKINHFSPNFIDGTDNFIYQDKQNKVYVVNANTKKVIKSFQGVPDTFHESLNKDMTVYAYTSKDSGINIAKVVDGKLEDIYSYGDKYMDMQLNTLPKFYDNKVIATTSKDSLLIFDLDKVFKDDKYTPIKISKNSGATMNAISPDGKYIYTADKQFGGIKYDIATNQVVQKMYYSPEYIDNVSYHKIGYNNGDFFNKVVNFKFIDNDKVIMTFAGVNQSYLWAALFDINKYKKKNKTTDTIESIKYLPLTKDPLKFITGDYKDNTDPVPLEDGYNTRMATSVEAHKLVLPKGNGGNGIMVYNYNPSDESLKLDWVVDQPKPESKGWFW
ncbi:hypothetical protein LO80_01440 [Candidatus Francisella endociliophora]|uniref:Uncharacterized protein n=1 Tax=Candidatus Francisella endociliophora TaxID=653937 RepID=A0A097EMJ3_9GAMM|nr:hypothetical protein [Francisella sp. FSC1006]AIT08768.1 hypothetical protein LO80_01440 [Francisella sp. FSC1006]